MFDLIFRGGDNVLVLEHAPDEELCQYFRSTLKLGLPKLEILSHGDYVALGERLRAGAAPGGKEILSEVAAHASAWVDGYVTDEVLCRIAAHLGKQAITTVEGSRRGNNKLLLWEHVRAEGLPVVAASVEEISGCLERLAALGFRAAVLKSQIGASGIGLVKIDDVNAPPFEKFEEHLFFEGPCLVQGWLEPGE